MFAPPANVMKRRLLNLLVILAPLPCLALWGYRYFSYDAVGFWLSSLSHTSTPSGAVRRRRRA